MEVLRINKAVLLMIRINNKKIKNINFYIQQVIPYHLDSYEQQK